MNGFFYNDVFRRLVGTPTGAARCGQCPHRPQTVVKFLIARIVCMNGFLFIMMYRLNFLFG